MTPDAPTPDSFAASAGSANDGKLTAEQRRNWRNVLVGMLGPYALMMSDEDIDKFRDKMQSAVVDSPNDEAERQAGR
jgi:hypothetical protein